MDKKDMMISVSSQMPEKRWIHTQGVMETARSLASQYGADPDRAELAALIHDVAKAWPVEQQRQYIIDHQLDLSLLDYNKELWHAEIGAHVARIQYGVADQEICDAIQFHTAGRAHMGLLEKIVWIADYIEPNRDFPGVHEARELAESSLEAAMLFGLNSTINVLIARNQQIHPNTFEARNALIREGFKL